VLVFDEKTNKTLSLCEARPVSLGLKATTASSIGGFGACHLNI